MYAQLHKKFDKHDRFGVAHTKWELSTIMQTDVVSGDKTGFPKPGHIMNFKKG